MQIGEKYDFHRENFCGSLTFAMPKDATLAIFAEKTFVNSHKTVKFAKVLSPSKVSRYWIFGFYYPVVLA